MLLKIVRCYPADPMVVHSGREAALELDAAHQMVECLVDVLMSEDSWDNLVVADHLAAHFVTGVDVRNGRRRIELLCFKLNAVATDDLLLSSLRYDRRGSIADRHSMFEHERSLILLGSLTRAVRVAWDWMSAAELLEVTSGLPAPLKVRLRAWILARAPDADADTVLAELVQAIPSRGATGDDVALVDRAVEVSNRTVIRDRCQTALGEAPTIAELSHALGDEQPLPERWLRSHSWVALLPSDLTESWTVPCQLIAASYGEFRREDLLEQMEFPPCAGHLVYAAV